MNVIPETCTAHVNFRYAPGRTPREAEERLRGADAAASASSRSTATRGSAPVALDHPLARKLIDGRRA